MLLPLLLAACGETAGLLVPLDSAADVKKTRTILAVTTRGQASEAEKGELFSGTRSSDLHYMSLTLSMPPGRAPGALPTKADKPDPAKDIALVGSRELSKAEFTALLRSKTVSKRSALVFTHGFNTKFDEAVVRFAQISDDLDFQGVPILFSWPSRGGVTEYGYDKDSANFSRDGMESLLTQLAREPNIANIDIFAHSMGNWLTMETLRQIAIAKDQKTLDRLRKIVLAAPDVDMDVFRTQMARLGALKSRIVLYASRDDYALMASRKVFGGKIRAGENTDLAQFREIGIEAHDLSNVEGGVGKNHDKAFGDGATITEIGRAIGTGGPVRAGTDIISEGVSGLQHTMTKVGQTLVPGAR